MDVLERIRSLKIERGWSEYQLAEKADVTQSTISTWFRTKNLPTIPSLEKICAAFNISLAQFFFEEGDTETVLTEKQTRLIHQFNRLSEAQQNSLLQFLENL
ncbi:MAG: helix-turn-helix transcriptional regulator [Treponema sp.]|uniref:helix-turn-helix domain-containing protein n=1 Tax=Treponema sp. TaxID=166 RepID=UPI0025E22EB5|nr:helix-turn-helix transcriptional regulator [Treponema sp.]MBQ8680476.1 helix-turn-helix transcriptional regulator [Treponema sp.]